MCKLCDSSCIFMLSNNYLSIHPFKSDEHGSYMSGARKLVGVTEVWGGMQPPIWTGEWWSWPTTYPWDERNICPTWMMVDFDGRVVGNVYPSQLQKHAKTTLILESYEQFWMIFPKNYHLASWDLWDFRSLCPSRHILCCQNAHRDPPKCPGGEHAPGHWRDVKNLFLLSP